jgi:hypothetical protein
MQGLGYLLIAELSLIWILVAESIFDSGELQPLLGAQSQVKLVLSRLGGDHKVFDTFAVEIHLLD